MPHAIVRSGATCLSTLVLLAGLAALGAGAVAVTPATALAAQAQRWLDEGDRRYDARDPVGALAAYDSAIAQDATSHAAHWKAARSAIDLGEYEPLAERAQTLFVRARAHAERAVAADSTSAEGYFQLARAVGRSALASGPRERVRLAAEVRELARRALAHKSEHPGALHILGVWHAEIMRLSGFQRLMARTFLGGKVLGEASWDSAAVLLERSAALEPERIVHRLDLGRVYADRRRPADARAAFEWIARAPITDYNDPHYKKAAADALRALK